MELTHVRLRVDGRGCERAFEPAAGCYFLDTESAAGDTRAVPKEGPNSVAGAPFNSFAMAQAQFDRVAERVGLDGATRDLLR